MALRLRTSVDQHRPAGAELSRFLRLEAGRVARASQPRQAGPHVIAEAAPDYSSSAMLALYPPAELAQRLAVEDGLDPADMHVTVAYLGDAADVDRDAVLKAATAVATRRPITGSVSGHARFTGGEQDVIVALVDSTGLEWLRRDAVDELAEQGIAIPAEHGYTPHLTITYLDPDADTPLDRLPAEPVEFGFLAVHHGEERVDLPFVPPPALVQVREAFAAGWAASGGPMTDRVKAASRVATRLAFELSYSGVAASDVLEATLQLGSLEGTWARIYDRREKLYTEHGAAILTAWRALVTQVDWAAVVRSYRRTIGLTEAVDQAERTRREDTAKAVALAALLALFDDTHDPHLKATIAAVEAGIRATEAEGRAGAAALVLDKAGYTGMDFDAAYADAEKALADLSTYSSEAAVWAGEIAKAAATDVGRALTRVTDDELNHPDTSRDWDKAMVDAAVDAVDGDTVPAVDAYSDMALGAGFAAGALAVYAAAGLRTVNFVTAGDGKVCQACLNAESASPYTLLEAPSLPRHPRCRCSHEPNGAIATVAYSILQYVTGG